MAVDWLSLVSYCLTYFLRSSQVLYTFLFTNGHLVFFVTSHSRSYLHPHPSSLLTGRPAALHASLPSKSKRETDFGHWETASKATGTTAGVQVRDTTARRGCNGSAPAAGIVPLPVAHLPFKKVSTAALKRHQSHEDGHRSRSSCLVEREIVCPLGRGGLDGAATALLIPDGDFEAVAASALVVRVSPWGTDPDAAFVADPLQRSSHRRALRIPRVPPRL
ncbi:hypothetical protein Q4I32_007272 [Leishmania shawi]|uniref:Uncharacterized protein n=1 Tax=Leishmania shawi TaxID=5680 RepID=A0AAW3B9R5_9TRYP